VNCEPLGDREGQSPIGGTLNLALLQEEINQLPAKTDLRRTQLNVGDLGRFAVSPPLKRPTADAEHPANFDGASSTCLTVGTGIFVE